MRTQLLSLSLLTLACTLTGCSNWGFPGVYRINVEQGNIVTQEMVDQLKPGMTRQQVRYILGTPMIEHTFDRDRWDYIYLLRNGTNTLRDNRLTVYFEGDLLTHFSGTFEQTADSSELDTPTEETEKTLDTAF
jgi:outer membrane protein assembly factor BamE